MPEKANNPTLEGIREQLALRNGKLRKDIVVAVNYSYNPRILGKSAVNLEDDELVVLQYKFFVSPITPVMPGDADEMNELMDGLVNFEPTKRVPFEYAPQKGKRDDNETPVMRAKLGHIYFDQDLGSFTRNLTSQFETNDPELKELLGDEMKSESTGRGQTLRRIYIFPFYTFAMAASVGLYAEGYRDKPYDQRTIAYESQLSDFDATLTDSQIELLINNQNPFPKLVRPKLRAEGT